MCELFAMSSTHPATVNYSLEQFARHGGDTRGNKDGWGISYFEGDEARLIKDSAPSADSPWVRFVAERKLESHCVIAHVRWATRGQPKLENTHPFEREMAGQRHVFAHNGTLEDVTDRLPFQSSHFRPVGDTDSEHAFCVLLQRLETLWRPGANLPDLEARLERVAAFAADARRLGQANFLYSDGDTLFAHGHRRRYQENGRITEPKAPGLNFRYRRCAREGEELACDGLSVRTPSEELRGASKQEIALLASVPLTDEGWTPVPEGTVIAFRGGREIARLDA